MNAALQEYFDEVRRSMDYISPPETEQTYAQIAAADHESVTQDQPGTRAAMSVLDMMAWHYMRPRTITTPSIPPAA